MIRAPIAVGVRKSIGVPVTSFSSPVGINPLSTGVYRSASIIMRWSRMLFPDVAPARLKYECAVRFTIVGLSVVAEKSITSSLFSFSV